MTPNQQGALEKRHARPVFFAELAFLSGTQRLCSWNHKITWGGFDWLGVGALGGISSLQESSGVGSSSVNLTLNIADPSWFALAVGPVEEYRRRNVKLYMCPLDEQYKPIDTPQRFWFGKMDLMTPGIDADGSGQIVLKCESRAHGAGAKGLRMSSAQQKKKHPGDTSFDRIPDLIVKQELWLSRRFQQR